MQQNEPSASFSLYGASLVEYEARKFKITKDQSFINLQYPLSDNTESGTNTTKVKHNPLTDTTDARLDTIIDTAIKFYDLLDARHELGNKYNDGHEPDSCNLQDVIKEIISNAELHGNMYSPNKVTWIEYTLTEDESRNQAVFTMTVRDEGKGFDYNHLRAKEELARGTGKSYHDYRSDKPKDETNGRGLFVVLRYFDTVTWNETGNEITITKTLTKTN